MSDLVKNLNFWSNSLESRSIVPNELMAEAANLIEKQQAKIVELAATVERLNKEANALYDLAQDAGVCSEYLRVNFASGHPTPQQTLNAIKQEDVQSEKQYGELTAKVELATVLQATIHDYIYLLGKTDDKEARKIIEKQLVDLMNLEYQRFSGENDNML